MRQRLETEKEQQKVAEAKNTALEAERRRLQREVEQKRQLRVQQQREREKQLLQRDGATDRLRVRTSDVCRGFTRGLRKNGRAEGRPIPIAGTRRIV